MQLFIFGWQFEGWEQVMDWVVVASAVSAVILLIIEIVRSVRDTKSLEKDHDILINGQKEVGQQITQERIQLENSLSKDHSEIRKENAHLTQMVGVLVENSIREEEKGKVLTANQQDIKTSLTILQGLERQMENLQMENIKLQAARQEAEKQLDKALKEIADLKKKNKELSVQLHYTSQEYDEPSL